MSYRLRIEPLGASVDVEPEQTVLDACLRAGIWLPHACCHGLCATCKVQVIDGEVEHGEASPFALMDFERDEGKTLACCATLQSDTVIEADIDEDPDAELIPVRDHVGTVTRIEALTPTIKGLFLRLDTPIRFQAGQYVNLEIPGLGIRRAFSLASPPSQGGEIELNVRIVPGGAGTGYLHEALKVGDTLKLSGPYGRFFVRRSARLPMLFMAGGSGLSSPRSMILDLLEQGSPPAITLVYGQRHRGELYYHEDFEALAARHPYFSYVPVLSHEPEGIAQYLSRLGLLFGGVEALDAGKRAWLEVASWQPLRRYVEDSLVVRDPFELFVAQNVALDGLLYPLVYERIVDDELSVRGASTIAMLTQFMSEWFAETRRWVDAVLKVAAAESNDNRDLLAEWTRGWSDRAASALEPVAAIALEGRAAEAVEEQRLALRARLRSSGIEL